jgi:Spy/CpxP family protein refolding chaperone
MNNRVKISLVAALVAVATSGVAITLAQDAAQPQQRREGRGPGGPGFGGPMRGPGGPAFGIDFRELELSEDQRGQLRKIRESHESEFRQVGEKLRTAREGLRELIEADAIDESAIRAKSTEVAAAEADFAILNAKVRAEAMQILTSEQQQKLKDLRASRQSQPMKRRGQGRH